MDMDGEMEQMSDCAEGAEDHPVTHFIKKQEKKIIQDPKENMSFLLLSLS